MRVALDATYSVDENPSGVAVYSREILDGLPATFPEDRFLRCFRWKQWRARPWASRLLLPPMPTFRADVFHALNQRADSRPARRVVATFHDLFVMTAEYSSREFRERFTKQARRAAGNSDAIIAVSRFTAQQVEELLRVPAARIRVIPHGTRQPASEGGEARKPMVLFVGAMQMRKNVSALMKAFEIMPPEWRLTLAGSTSGYGAEKVLREARESPCAARIAVTGYVSGAELAGLYGSASIFAFPSLGEGFGIPVLEAMAHGVPVIASNGSALRELAEGAALLVNPEREEELAAALSRLAGDPALRASLAQKGKQRSREYTWERAVRETRLVYGEL